MEIDFGGWTFVTVDDLRNGGYTLLNNIQKDKSKVLFRLSLKRDSTIQPYTIIEELAEYSKSKISTQINENIDYAPTKNKGSYVYNGLIKISDTVVNSKYGFKSNGKNLTFTNCDGDPNAYFAFFNPPSSPSTYGGIGRDITDTWRVIIIHFSNIIKKHKSKFFKLLGFSFESSSRNIFTR